jgi:hypothetical protein
MSVTAQDLKKIAPELESETTPRLQFFIDFAVLNVNASVFLDKTDKAVTLLAAHFITMANRGGAGGSVASEKVGDLARSYAAPSGKTSESELATTAYGQMFLTLLKSLSISPRVVGCL